MSGKHAICLPRSQTNFRIFDELCCADNYKRVFQCLMFFVGKVQYGFNANASSPTKQMVRFHYHQVDFSGLVLKVWPSKAVEILHLFQTPSSFTLPFVGQ